MQVVGCFQPFPRPGRDSFEWRRRQHIGSSGLAGQFIERIRETYPFHPSIRDIVARFAENRGYQKTRALIRLLRLAVRGALKTNDNAFLVGLQH